MRYTNKDKIEIIKNRNQVEFFFGGGGYILNFLFIATIS